MSWPALRMRTAFVTSPCDWRMSLSLSFGEAKAWAIWQASSAAFSVVTQPHHSMSDFCAWQVSEPVEPGQLNVTQAVGLPATTTDSSQQDSSQASSSAAQAAQKPKKQKKKDKKSKKARKQAADSPPVPPEPVSGAAGL